MDPNPYESPKAESLLAGDIEDTPAIRQCHQCDGHEFKIWTPFHPLIIHWMVNPGLAVNELCFGQRIPRTLFVCKNCGDWFRPDTQFIECPDCKRFHSARIWEKCGFGNWFGLVCPDCGASIPCVLNLTSLLILVMLFPVWWPLSFWFGRPYRQWAQRRVANSRRIAQSQNAAQHVVRPGMAQSASCTINTLRTSDDPQSRWTNDD